MHAEKRVCPGREQQFYISGLQKRAFSVVFDHAGVQTVQVGELLLRYLIAKDGPTSQQKHEVNTNLVVAPVWITLDLSVTIRSCRLWVTRQSC